MKKFFVTLALMIGILGSTTQGVLASENSNLPVDEIKQLIANEAREQGIPPEILKAIARQESKFMQFNTDGTPNISPDGGIGIMQVTPDKIDIPVDVDIDRLKTDTAYNIEVAAQVLEEKWELTYLPKLNNQDKSVMENWYFAIMAYNGLSKSNDPNINAGNTYQERVYEKIEDYSFIRYEIFEFPTFDIRYEDNNDTMFFPPEKNYKTTSITPSRQMYKTGDIVYVDGRDGAVGLHKGTINGSVDEKLWPYSPLTIVSGPVESSDKDNDFAYYYVKGVDTGGYVASTYLIKGSKDMLFNDPIDNNRAAALAFASMNGYVQGYPTGDFGSNDALKREHVAVILDNILDLSAPDDYEMVADDVKTDNPYYEQLKAVEYNKYLGGGGKLRPKENLTRSQMAQVMVEAFDTYYDPPTSKHIFADQGKLWNPEEVNTIYFNDVTIADPFRPSEEITRSQFAIFIYRTMVDF